MGHLLQLLQKSNLVEPKGIIYDFDGVICDSVNVKTDAFATMFSSYGQEIQKEVVAFHLQNGGISRFEKFRHYYNNLLCKQISEETVNKLADDFALLVKDKVINSPYIKNADFFIERHSKKVKQYICTGTPETEMIEIAEKKNIAHFFKGIFGSPRKKTDIINSIIASTGFLPEEFIYFGDATTDFVAAMECSVPFIGIYSPETIFPAGTKVIHDFSNLDITSLLLK